MTTHADIIARLEAEVERLTRLLTDERYLRHAYRNMLGENGLKVAEMWDRQGVTRIHFDWGEAASDMTGEQRAEFILGIEQLPKHLVEDGEFDDD